MDAKLSSVLESFIQEMTPGEDVRFINETLPQIRQLEARVDRAEHRYRNLRLQYNSLTKAVKQIRLITSEHFLNPQEPERYDDDGSLDDL